VEVTTRSTGDTTVLAVEEAAAEVAGRVMEAR
jgi:hypothetical protein